MPRKRNRENAGLPSRWAYTHGAYYYYVPKGLEAKWDGKRRFRLGSNLADAYRVWLERGVRAPSVYTVGDLLDRYALEVLPHKAPATRTSQQPYIPRLRAVFGSMPLTSIKPRHVYTYRDKRAGKTAADRELEVLSHAFTKAIEWGYIDRHPFKGQVRIQGHAPRQRYVEDWEVVEALSLPSRQKRGSVGAIQAYMRLKLLTGLRQSDLLRLRIEDCRADGIHVTAHKTEHSSGKATIYIWSDALRRAVEGAKTVRPVHISPLLFCTRLGDSYMNEEIGKAPSWNSMWQRFMKRLTHETNARHFQERDLRAKVASDAESLEHARALLAHADARTTRRIYMRRPERVRPAQ